MMEEELTIPTSDKDVQLSGTLCLPDKSTKPSVVVVMVHGSGPMDRDENVTSMMMGGQKLNVFNTIAHHLASTTATTATTAAAAADGDTSTGIASFRYDKRGCGKSTGDYDTAGHTDFVQDAIACVDYLLVLSTTNTATTAKNGPFRFSQVYMLGHSEGTLIAAQVGIHRPDAVMGMMLLCPFLSNLEHVMVQQAQQVKSDLDAMPGIGGWVIHTLQTLHLMPDPIQQQRDLLDKVKASSLDVERFGPLGWNKIQAKWLRELMALEPRDIYAQLAENNHNNNKKKSILIVGGEKDLQCDPKDTETIASILLLSSSNDNNSMAVESHIVPNLSHILRLEEKDPSFLRYPTLLKNDMAPIVLELIQEWMRKQQRQ